MSFRFEIWKRTVSYVYMYMYPIVMVGEGNDASVSFMSLKFECFCFVVFSSCQSVMDNSGVEIENPIV